MRVLVLRPDRPRRGRRNDDDDDLTQDRPSAPATLFDFLTTKISTKNGTKTANTSTMQGKANLVTLHFLLYGWGWSLVTPLYGHCCYLLHLPSSSALHLLRQSSRLGCNPPCSLQHPCSFVSDLFGDLSSFILTMCPAHLIRLYWFANNANLSSNFFS